MKPDVSPTNETACTDHFRSLTKMLQMTLEQLRDMTRPTPVWAEIEGKTVEGWDGYWCLCVKGYILTPGKILMCAEKMREAKFYIYPPANIDREPCELCATFDEIICQFSKRTEYDQSATSKFMTARFCPKCGRPLTEKAWVELEKHLMVLMN